MRHIIIFILGLLGLLAHVAPSLDQMQHCEPLVQR
jgi:hypothetical protein